MNIFHTYAVKSLKKNRARTIVTVIGIILSAAMLTAVTTMVSSIRQYGITYEEASVGDWHVRVYGVDAQKLLAFRNDERIDRVYELQNMGYAYLENGENEYKPYLRIQEMNEGFASHMPLTLTEGRMPENETEVLLPSHVKENGGVELHMGDVLELSVGERVDENGNLIESPSLLYLENADGTMRSLEHIKAERECAYTVVGFYERPVFERYTAPGYTVLTMDSGKNITGEYDCYLVMKHPKHAIGLWEELSQEGSYETECNNALLRFYGYSVRGDFNAVVYGMGSILIAIIVLGSVALIYNAFAISVSERTKQFGILSSVGATKRQMKKTVCFEALLLCTVGIPAGILSGICGIGITLFAFQDELEYLVGEEKGVSMRLCVSPEAVIIAAVIGVITVLISAYLPMRRALKVSTIEAIRQKEDIRLTKKKLRIPGWVGRFFGLSGTIAWKNFKRNKKQYRTTIFSLSLSILLFVSAGSFSEYLFGSYRDAVKVSPYDINIYHYENTYEELLAVTEKLCGVDGAALVYQLIYLYTPLELEESILTGEARELYQDSESLDAAIIFLPDDIFEELLSYYKLDDSKYQNIRMPQAVVFNHVGDWWNNEEIEINVLQENCRSLRRRGTEFQGKTELAELTIGDVVENSVKNPTEFSEGCLSLVGSSYLIKLIYPMSAAPTILQEGNEGENSHDRIRNVLFFKAENHDATADSMRKIVGGDDTIVYDVVAAEEQSRALYLMINVFCFGFIILISLISAANIFNTISTNMNLRRREFAMLKSLGMTQKEYRRMLNFECIIYGVKGLGIGFLLSFLSTILMYYAGHEKTMEGFYLPWRYFVISIVCVFGVVYATMLYGRTKAKKENLIDAMKV